MHFIWLGPCTMVVVTGLLCWKLTVAAGVAGVAAMVLLAQGFFVRGPGWHLDTSSNMPPSSSDSFP